MRLPLTGSEARRLADRLQVWKAEPVTQVRELFNAEPDPWQKGALEAFPTRQRQCIVTCTNSGKTTFDAWAIWNFLSTRPHAQGKATSITFPNLKDNLRKELAYWYGVSPLLQQLFEFRAESIVARGFEKTWFLSFVAWDRDAVPEHQGKVLAGLHAKHVLFVIDEAGGVPTAVSQTAENALADAECEEAHVILSGNPLDLTGALFEAAVERPETWQPLFISGDPDDPNRAPRCSLSWARQQIADFGRDNAFVQVYVLGRFPSAATDALISIAEFEEAFARWNNREELASHPKTLGVDVARHGKHRTVVVPRAGDLIWDLFLDGEKTWWTKQDTTFSSGRVVEIANAWAGKDAEPKAIPIYIDDIGVGGGVTDQVKAAGFNAIGVNVESAASDPKKHANLKSEIGLQVQSRFRAGTIALHPGLRKTTLMAEGSSMKVVFRAGRRKVEGKEDYQRRTGRSPDVLDAFLNCFAGEAGPVTKGQMSVGKLESSGEIFQEEY